MAVFKLAFDKTMVWEGGYVNDPNDPGGETHYGISKKQYPRLDIKNLTREKASDIYRIDYWGKIRAGELVEQMTANAVFDMAVNSGVRRATKMAQECVLTIQDGIVGPQTIRKLNAVTGAEFVNHYALRRIRFYVELATRRKHFERFLVGWLRRALDFI